MGLLDTISQPQQLKALSPEQLQALAAEIRELLVTTVARTGGHLAPNLGVVELSIALHRVFNSPIDKIVWDVGHQAYVHKILTGRRDAFATLRQSGGISGFPKRWESRHDTFDTGHSSTSISAALGMAIARDLAGEKNSVVAVIGDGSLTGGMAYEALNNAGALGKNLIVVLNDNKMSIAKNVGALSDYLAALRTAPTYSRVKRDIDFLLRRIPAIGDKVAKTVERLKDSLKYLIVPGMWFEKLGFTYLGPIDGHNITQLVDVLEKAKNMDGPILIHVLTCKGRGYKPAEDNPDKFHGVGPFCIDTGELIKHGTAPSYTSVFADVLIQIAATNEKITAITAAMPDGTGLRKFSAVYPDRFFDVGIAEQHAVTVAAGMATQGYRPVVAVYSTFLQRAYDQILHDVCLQKLPVILALDRAGIVGEDGPTHHGVFDYSFLRHMPNIVIMAPKDEAELRHMLYTATKLNGPAALRYPRGCGQGVPVNDELQELTVGKAEILRVGTDLTFFAVGATVQECMLASDSLAAEHISAGVINARFIKPLDQAALNEIVSKPIVTVEDNVLAGGFGAGVLEALDAAGIYDAKVLRLGLPDKFIEQGTRQQLLAHYALTAPGIAEQSKKFIQQMEQYK